MSLDEIREQIDQIDDQIVALLAQRQRHLVRAATYKADDAEIQAPRRRARMMERLRTRAVEEDLDAEVVVRVFDAMIDGFIDLERREHRALRQAGDRTVHGPKTQRIASGSPYEATIGFSRAVRIGDRILVSGTAPIWPDGSCAPDAATQARRCFEIIAGALTEAGASLHDVVRSRVLLVDVADADAVSAVHGEIYGQVRPAATMAAVGALLDSRWKVEIEAEAVVHGDVRQR